MCLGVERGDRMGTSLFFKVFSKMGTILQIKNVESCQMQKQMFWIVKLLGIGASCLALLGSDSGFKGSG
jgi:hypothetical protein